MFKTPEGRLMIVIYGALFIITVFLSMLWVDKAHAQSPYFLSEQAIGSPDGFGWYYSGSFGGGRTIEWWIDRVAVSFATTTMTGVRVENAGARFDLPPDYDEMRFTMDKGSPFGLCVGEPFAYDYLSDSQNTNIWKTLDFSVSGEGEFDCEVGPDTTGLIRYQARTEGGSWVLSPLEIIAQTGAGGIFMFAGFRGGEPAPVPDYPQDLTTSRFWQWEPPGVVAVTQAPYNANFNIQVISAYPQVDKICVDMQSFGADYGNGFQWDRNCATVVQSGLVSHEFTRELEAGVHQWGATLYGVNGDIIDMIMASTISVGSTNTAPFAEQWIAMMTASATTTPSSVDEFCDGVTLFGLSAEGACKLMMRMVTPVTDGISDSLLGIRTVILNKVPFVYIAQIRQAFVNANIEEVEQFDGITLKVWANTEVEFLTNEDIEKYATPGFLTLLRNMIIMVVWLSVLMFFWGQRNKLFV